VATLPITVCMLLLASKGGELGTRIGPRIPMTVGPIVMAGGSLLLLRVGPDVNYWTDVLPGLTVFGLGLALMVAPLTATVLAAVADEHAGIASGVNNAVARAAGLLAVAVLPLAAGIGAGSLTNADDLHPVYRNAMLICAGLMVAGGILAAIFVPDRLPAHAPPVAAAEPRPEPARAGAGPRGTQAGVSRAGTAHASPIRTFCDPAGPPVHPRGR
jgi:MFS family permease